MFFFLNSRIFLSFSPHIRLEPKHGAQGVGEAADGREHRRVDEALFCRRESFFCFLSGCEVEVEVKEKHSIDLATRFRLVYWLFCSPLSPLADRSFRYLGPGRGGGGPDPAAAEMFPTTVQKKRKLMASPLSRRRSRRHLLPEPGHLRSF